MTEEINKAIAREYEAGFVTDIASETFEPGLNEDVIRRISVMKQEPEWMLEWRLKAYAAWLEMDEPDWAHVQYPKIDFQEISYSHSTVYIYLVFFIKKIVLDIFYLYMY